MNFDWREYLYLAYTLSGQPSPAVPSPSEEARLRTSISRAYYASFIVARNYLRDVKKLIIPTRGTHQFVIDHYGTDFPGNLVASEIGAKLGRMRTHRENVDYEDSLGSINLRATSIFDLTYADSVINLVNSLPR
jgi:uncharacterized protein (UPF0332 family)